MKKMLRFYEAQLKNTSKDAKKLADDNKEEADRRNNEVNQARTKLEGAVTSFNEVVKAAVTLEEKFNTNFQDYQVLIGAVPKPAEDGEG